MIDQNLAKQFQGKYVSLLIQGKFYKGVITHISGNHLILRFNTLDQLYSFDVIDGIQEVK